jgi:hypothetical protein
LPPDVEENVKQIHASIVLEVQLIDDLLDLTKISRCARFPFPQNSRHNLRSMTPALTHTHSRVVS